MLGIVSTGLASVLLLGVSAAFFSYQSTNELLRATGKLTFIVAAPLWKDVVPNTGAVGAVYFVPKETFMNDIVATIQGVVQNNSATTKQSATASEELSAQAQILKDLIENFTLMHETALTQQPAE